MTRALQSSPFQISGGVPRALWTKDKGRKSSCLILDTRVCLIFSSCMLPPKLRHISRSLAFSEFFSVKKNVLYPGQITFWKYDRISIFWLVEIFTETLQKKFRIKMWTFSFQTCFRNQFPTSGSGQTEDTQIHVFVYFLFYHFPKSKIDSKSRF